MRERINVCVKWTAEEPLGCCVRPYPYASVRACVCVQQANCFADSVILFYFIDLYDACVRLALQPREKESDQASGRAGQTVRGFSRKAFFLARTRSMLCSVCATCCCSCVALLLLFCNLSCCSPPFLLLCSNTARIAILCERRLHPSLFCSSERALRCFLSFYISKLIIILFWPIRLFMVVSLCCTTLSIKAGRKLETECYRARAHAHERGRRAYIMFTAMTTTTTTTRNAAAQKKPAHTKPTQPHIKSDCAFLLLIYNY